MWTHVYWGILKEELAWAIDKWLQVISNISYNTGKSALPDIYAQRQRASAYISGKAQVPML